MDKEYLSLHWQNVRASLLETIAKFQNDELDFVAYPGGRSVREVILHIAQEEYGEFNYGILQTLHDFPAEYDPNEYPTKETIKVLLEKVHASAAHYLATIQENDLKRIVTTPWGPQYSLLEMIGHMIEHEIHHRGELSLILGILGREGLNA